MISEKSFKRFVIFSFFLACLSFFIGTGWNHKEMKRLKYAGEIAFWELRNAAMIHIQEKKFQAEDILILIEGALDYKEYSNASDQVINQLEYCRDSLTVEIQNI